MKMKQEKINKQKKNIDWKFKRSGQLFCSMLIFCYDFFHTLVKIIFA